MRFGRRKDERSVLLGFGQRSIELNFASSAAAGAGPSGCPWALYRTSEVITDADRCAYWLDLVIHFESWP